MQKTKLGISVGMVGAAMFFLCLFGGYIPALLLGGYILLVEENIWLRKTAVKAIALSICFSVLIALINLLPNLFSVITNISIALDDMVNLNKIDSVFTAIITLINMLEKVVFLVLGLSSFTQGTLKIPVVDSLIQKYMN